MNPDLITNISVCNQFVEEFGIRIHNYVVIQIDTDFMLKGEVSEEFRIDIQMLTVEKTIDAFKQKFITLIGDEFYAEYQQQILFAIAVNEIECWLLPIKEVTTICNSIND